MPGGSKRSADPVLVLAIAAGLSTRQAAEQAGVAETTVYRRLHDPDFQRQVTEAKAATLQQTADRLSAASLKAVSTLLALLSARSESTRLGAARAILELAAKFRETANLEVRIAALEAYRDGPEDSRWAS